MTVRVNGSGMVACYASVEMGRRGSSCFDLGFE